MYDPLQPIYTQEQLQQFIDLRKAPEQTEVDLLKAIIHELQAINKEIICVQNALSSAGRNTASAQDARHGQEPGSQAEHWHQTEATGDEDSRLNSPEPASHRYGTHGGGNTGSTQRVVRPRRR